MAKTQKPLSILVMDQVLFQSPEVQALHAKGHQVHFVTEAMTIFQYDVVIGPQCWRVEQGLGDLEAILEMVLKGVRTKRYGAKKGSK